MRIRVLPVDRMVGQVKVVRYASLIALSVSKISSEVVFQKWQRVMTN